MVNVNIREITLLDADSSRTILEKISFTLHPGNIYCLIGKNGSGKTTLLKSLTSLHNKNIFDVAGEVFFKGTNILPMNDDYLESLRQKYVKYVFQDSVSSFNPLKKLEYYFDLPGIDQNMLFRQLKALMLPTGNIIGKMYPYEISGGMAQRFSIALALSAKPLLLLLDEPNSGIDYALSNLISNALKSYAAESNSAVLIITQDISFAENTGNYLGFINKNSFTGFFSRSDFFTETGSNAELNNFIEAYKSI